RIGPAGRRSAVQEPDRRLDQERARRRAGDRSAQDDRAGPGVARQGAGHTQRDGRRAAQLPAGHGPAGLGRVDGRAADPWRAGGQSSASATPTTPGPHGHSVDSVSVGGNTLTPAPAVNRISGGSSPTFTVSLTNGGASTEHNVKVDVSVVAGGKTVTATKTI